LNVYYDLKIAEPFLPAGYTISTEQFAWSGAPRALTFAAANGKLTIEKPSGKALVKEVIFL
jgi:beta-galactosidase